METVRSTYKVLQALELIEDKPSVRVSSDGDELGKHSCLGFGALGEFVQCEDAGIGGGVGTCHDKGHGIAVEVFKARSGRLFVVEERVEEGVWVRGWKALGEREVVFFDGFGDEFPTGLLECQSLPFHTGGGGAYIYHLGNSQWNNRRKHLTECLDHLANPRKLNLEVHTIDNRQRRLHHRRFKPRGIQHLPGLAKRVCRDDIDGCAVEGVRHWDGLLVLAVLVKDVAELLDYLWDQGVAFDGALVVHWPRGGCAGAELGVIAFAREAVGERDFLVEDGVFEELRAAFVDPSSGVSVVVDMCWVELTHGRYQDQRSQPAKD